MLVTSDPNRHASGTFIIARKDVIDDSTLSDFAYRLYMYYVKTPPKKHLTDSKVAEQYSVSTIKVKKAKGELKKRGLISVARFPDIVTLNRHNEYALTSD